MWLMETGVGYDITLWFNNLGGGFWGTILKAFNFIGSDYFYILLFPLIFWCINKSIGKRVLILALLTAYINILLKSLWMRPRPYDVIVSGKNSIINRLNLDDNFGFPSSHVMGVTSLWMYISTLSKKISTKLLCYIIIMLTAISRMIHGVNFFHGVFAAVIFSLIVLLLFKLFEPKITVTCNQKYTIGQRILLICFFTVAAIVLLIFSEIDNINQAVIFVGCFFGATIGIVLEKEFLNFKVDGSLILRIGRYFLGMILISLVYYGFEELYNFMDTNSNIIQFFKYGIIAFITVYPIPKLFTVMNLCSPDGIRHL